MYTGEIFFTSLPEIGFAMRHLRSYYNADYGNGLNNRIEIAYINSGGINLTFNGEKMYAPEGSIVVLFRHLPISVETVGDGIHSHDTVLGEFEDINFLLSNKETFSKQQGLEIPFVTPPSVMTEKIGIEIRQIISDMTDNRESKGFYASLTFVNILKRLSDIYASECKDSLKVTRESVAQIKKYINDNIDKNINISQIASHIGKSPNYTGQLFKKHMSMTITEYVNLQKMKKISNLIKEKQIPFSDAVEIVSICDESYGYRLFKKYIGITPGEFLKANCIESKS